MEYNTYTIKMVAELTGLTELVIRAWEKRYDVVNPERSSGNRRSYSEKDVEKLTLLKNLTDNNYRIGNIAHYSIEELKDILTLNELKNSDKSGNLSLKSNLNYLNIINECIHNIRRFNTRKLETILLNCSVEFSRKEFIDNIIIPLMSKVGEYWTQGILRVGHEHFASTAVRKIITTLIDGFKIDENSPTMLLATPQGQYHEIGALIAGALASGEGWNVTYLGPSLPVEEIVFVSEKIEPTVVFLSLVYPSDDPQLGFELKKLEKLELNSKILFSGSSIGGYKKIIEDIGGTIVNSSDELRAKLKNIRDKIN